MSTDQDFSTDTKEWRHKSKKIVNTILPLLDGLSLNQVKNILCQIESIVSFSTPLMLQHLD